MLKPLTQTAVDWEVELLITVQCIAPCDEIIHVSAETVDGENRLQEDVRAAVEPTPPLLPPTEVPVPLDPCEG